MLERNKILIVDDNNENIRVLLEILKRDYQLNATTDGYKAIEIAKKWDPDLILLDVVMPNINGYDVCMQLRSLPETKDIPIVFVTAISSDEEQYNCISVGALDYIIKPINPTLLKAKIKNFVAIKNDRRMLSGIIDSKRTQIDECENVMMYVSISLAEFRDKRLGKWHIKRCVEYAKIMIKALMSNINYKELASTDLGEAICSAVPYHDIGKSMLPDSIILKPDKLTAEEYELIKSHVLIGGDLIESISAGLDNEDYTKTALDLIKYHHERWDGTGYPEGLAGKKIPLAARLMALIDQYDTMTSRRVYRSPSHHFEAVKLISAESGKGLDPELVYTFLKVQEQFLEVMRRFPDEEIKYGLINEMEEEV